MALADPLSLVGTTIADKYEIERVVGEGGFAIVYRARHKVWNRPVAIKVFRALGDLPHERRVQLVESFLQEGRLLADLSERTATIVQARDVGMLPMHDGREMPFMVLEWLEGRSLEQVLEDEKRDGLPPRTAEQALHLLEPAGVALALAHRSGIAHRDVKPANLFLLGDPRGDFSMKVLDFGIAKVVQDAHRASGSFAQTQGGISSFTPAYGAPEQFSRTHGTTGPWTDVFAVALVFTELLTHVPPLQGDDLTQLAFSSMDPRRRPTPRAFGVTVPDALEAVLSRALAVSVEERYRSMGEFWEALRNALTLEPMRLGGVESVRRAPPVSAPFEIAASSTHVPTAPAPSLVTVPGPPAPPATSSSRSGAAVVAVGLAVMLVVGLGLTGAAIYRRSQTKPLDPASASAAPSTASASAAPVAVKAPSCPAGMSLIPAGRYFMGSDDRTDEERERPAHQVVLGGYCMDTTEVTVAAYKACSDAGGCKRAPRENDFPDIGPRDHKLYDPLCTIRDPEGQASHPINCVDWELAQAFCEAAGKRLPTEAEWEFAARGSDGRKYPWGDDPPKSGDFLNACGKECVAWGKKHPDPDFPLKAMYGADDGWATTAPVGSFPKGNTQAGLADIVGNVWEWTADWFGEYGTAAQTDPKGPPTGTMRVMRGGAWNGSDAAWVRPSFRFMAPPTLRSHGVGFRCAKPL